MRLVLIYVVMLVLGLVAASVKGSENLNPIIICKGKTYDIDDAVIGESEKGKVVYTISDFKDYNLKDCFYSLEK